MAVAKKQIIKNLVFNPPGLGHPIHGRIIKTKDGKFGWEISYHWQAKQTTKTYYPDAISGDSAAEMEQHLKTYVNGFTGSFSVKENLNY